MPGSGFLFDCQRLEGEKKGSVILEGKKRKPVSKRHKVSVLIKSGSRRRTQTMETERDGLEEGIEKCNREVKGGTPESLRQRVKNVGLAGWVKGALVPIKSHYCRLITQGSCCLHRYEQWLWYMNNSAGKKDTGIREYSGIWMGLCKGPKRHNAQRERAQVNPRHHKI